MTNFSKVRNDRALVTRKVAAIGLAILWRRACEYGALSGMCFGPGGM